MTWWKCGYLWYMIAVMRVSDNVYDTERKGNNNPIIHINKANNLLTDITFFKESRAFRVAPDFLSKGYIEFETGVLMTADLTANIRFFDQDFVVSIVVYEEDFENSNDTLLAPSAPNQPPNKYFNNFIQTIIINNNGKNKFIYKFKK